MYPSCSPFGLYPPVYNAPCRMRCGYFTMPPWAYRPTIVIMQGDDSNAIGLEPITISVATPLDLTGCEIVFSFLGFTQKFTDSEFTVEDGKVKLTVTIDKTVSASFPLGFQFASVSITDTDGKNRMLNNKILTLVTNNPAFAYGINNNVDVVVPTSFAHVLDGETWNAGDSIGSMRDIVGKIAKALGADVTPREEN